VSKQKASGGKSLPGADCVGTEDAVEEHFVFFVPAKSHQTGPVALAAQRIDIDLSNSRHRATHFHRLARR
jgi:hypothetical protein